MNLSKCPHCAVALGNFMYADACPHCQRELEHNRKPTLTSTRSDPLRKRSWPVLWFLAIVRFVES